MTGVPTYNCDVSQAMACKGGSVEHPGWTIAATMLASSLAFVDGSVTNVALATIGRDLGGSSAELPWVVNAYLLPLSALILLGGAAGDHFGRKRMLVAGIILFTIASVGCALAQNLEQLFTARAFQGLGAAMLMPNSLGILGSSFKGEARGRAVGTWAAAGAIANAVGPPLGGWLVDTVGWRVIFYLNVPVAACALFVTLRFVKESDPDKGPLDWSGAILATAALGLLTWSLTRWSTQHGASAGIWIGLGVGIACLALFVRAEHHLGERAMMPLALFASRPFVGLTILTFLLYGALGGLFMLLPYLLIVGGGYSPTQAGFALLPFPIVVGTASRIAGRLTGRIGPRLPLTIGPIVTGVGFALLEGADPVASYWTSILPGMVVVALGMACSAAPLTTAVLSSVDDQHTGTASGFNSAIARTGGLVAIALAGAVISVPAAELARAFQIAAIAAAVLAVLSGIVAFVTLAGGPSDQNRSHQSV